MGAVISTIGTMAVAAADAFGGLPHVAHHVIAGMMFIAILATTITFLRATKVTDARPTGWGTTDPAAGYDATRHTRQVTADPSGTPLMNYTIATANYAGIFTEDNSAPLKSRYIGTVDMEAVVLQVEGGARALVFDIWPDPENLSQPVVCTMARPDLWASVADIAPTRGTGLHSNWQITTRNTSPAGPLLAAAVATAHPQGQEQVSDPLFLILRLHGAMTVPYLDTLAAQLQNALAGTQMGAESATFQSLTEFMTNTTLRQAQSRTVVIVSPEVNVISQDGKSGFNSLPGMSVPGDFLPIYMNSKMADLTNVMDLVGSLQLAENVGTGSAFDPSKAAYIIQPTVGDVHSDNTGPRAFTANNTYATLVNRGFQFVAVNMFGWESSSAARDSFTKTFGTQSFVKVR